MCWPNMRPDRTEPGNPYRRGAESDCEAGLDAKVGLASNLTMDLTVNPDFGQVEADPSRDQPDDL